VLYINVNALEKNGRAMRSLGEAWKNKITEYSRSKGLLQ
jgi:hypothetical protein